MPHRLAAAHPSPFVRFHLVALIAVITLALTAPVHAVEPWDAPAFSADPAAMVRAAAALPAPANASDPGVDVLLMESVYSYDEAGKETYTQRLVYRFKDGKVHESWSAIEESWAPWHQERPTLRARVITLDGVAHQLDPATVTENAETASGPDMFEDGRVLRAPLPATGSGSVVEQEVVVRETAPFFQAGTVQYANLQLAVPVRRVRLVLEAPAGLPLRWIARKLPGAAPREELSGGRRRLTFEIRDLGPWEAAEPGLPPEVPRTAYVAFSTGRSWSDLSRRYSEIVDQAIRGSDVAAFLRSAGSGASQSGSQVETIDKLLSKLGSEIRYTGIELGQGSLLPRTPAETLKRKFGDCKDKAVLLTALLRSLDIPAYVALLNAGEGDPDVEESLPGLGAFNHAIVMVPGNPAVWIDPTEPFARAGELPVQDQGRLALVASPTATGLVRTPEATSADNREVETREFFLSDLGGARVVETTDYWGAQEQELRSSYAGSDNEGVREALGEYATEAYLADNLAGVDYSDSKDLSRPFRLRLEVMGADRGTTDVREAAVAIFLSSFVERLSEELTGTSGEDEEEAPGPRVNDYVFSRPLQLEVRYRIVPPAGFALQPLPASRARRFGPARLEEAYTEGKDGVVEATLRFDTGKRRISPAEFEALREGLRELSGEKPVMISFEQVGEAHLAAGRIREALDEFRKLAARDPKKALPGTRIARALLAGGLGEAARQEAEEATRLDPKLVHAWTTLGWIRQHDDMGRRFGKGFDRAGSIQAYRKAVELSPDSGEARGDLAILLEHDAEGSRYAPGAELAAAIAEYEAMKEELDGLGLPNNLAIAYMWAGRFDDMKKTLDAMTASESVTTLRLVAVAATSGPEAAIKEAERAFPDAESRANALSGAARNLMLTRRYPEAASLFEQAGRRSSNAAALLNLAELLRKTRRHEELTLSARDPASAVRRLLSAAASSSLSPETFERLMSKDLVRGLSVEERQKFWTGFQQGFKASLQAAKSADVPVAVAMDLGLAVLRDTVTGDDALGYRVVMAASVGEGSRRAVFVVPEEGEYRIVATDKTLYMMSDEVRRRLARQDLRGARQWLDWAWDELQGVKPADPMASPPLLALWSKGSEGDGEQIRCAAAVLLTWTEHLGKVLPELTSCRDAAPQGPRRDALELSLLTAYQAMNRSTDAADTAHRLQESAPASENLFLQQLVALGRLDRWDDLRQVVEGRKAQAPDDPMVYRTLADIAMRKGDFPGAETILQRLIDSGKADPGAYNDLAWLLVFQGKTDERALELAQRAANLSHYKLHNVLHTLASIYAEQGKTAEAYRLALQAMEVAGGEPTYSDWYVFGRLAEQYGMPEAARRCYERARWTSEGKPDPTSSIHLARRRLEALGSRPAEPKRTASRP